MTSGSSAQESGAKRPRGVAARFGRWLAGAIVSLGLIATVFAGSLFAVETLKRRAALAEKPAPTPPLSVEVIALKRSDGYTAVERFAGRLEPARATDLAFERAGRVVEVRLDEGDRVAEKDVVARLDTARLAAERLRLEAEETRIKAQLELARRTQSRQDALKRRGFASGQAADEAAAQEAALEASLAAIAAQKQALDVDLARSVLEAPFAGLIASRSVDPGAYVAPGAPVARLLEIDKPQARIGLPPERARELDPSRAYEIEVGDQKFAARLAAQRPDLSPTTRTVAILFDVAAPEGARKPVFGEVARLAMTRRFEEPGAWLPLTALQEGVKGLWSVYVAEPFDEDGARGHRLTQEAVEVIHVAGARAYVRIARADGAKIVVSGSNRVTRGQAVEPVLTRSAAGALLGAGR